MSVKNNNYINHDPDEKLKEEIEIGDKVTFVDGKLEKHRAIVFETFNDKKMVNLAIGRNSELGRDYNSETYEVTSVQHIDDRKHRDKGHYYMYGWYDERNNKQKDEEYEEWTEGWLDLYFEPLE